MNDKKMTNTQLLVRTILSAPLRYEWSIQGLGMLRMYLSKEVRLHIWHLAYRVPGVSDIHDHPWDFESEVVCGWIRDHEYELVAGEPTHQMQVIRCGTGGGVFGEPSPVRLQKVEAPAIGITKATGSVYRHESTAIHRSEPANGTVTIVRRTFKTDTEHARVFFPLGTEWVSAEPRQATVEEVIAFTGAAMRRLIEQ